jgi:hypothetical protein
LHFEVATKFRDAIKAGAPWALMMALRNMPRWRWDRYDKQTGMPAVADAGEPSTIKVQFVVPSKRPEEPEPPPSIDLTPQGPQPQPNYDLKVLPKPSPRIETPFGWLEQRNDKGKGWMR